MFSKKKRKGFIDIKTIGYMLLIPIVLIIMVIIFGSFESATPSAFYNQVTGETLNLTGANNTYVSLSNCEQGLVDDSNYDILVYNTTTTLTEDTNYAVDYDDCKIKAIDGTTNNSAWSCDYYYMRDGYASYEDTANQAYNAFNIASILPLVVIAVLIISILMAGFLKF